MSLVPFPTEIPLAEVSTLIGEALRHKNVLTKKSANVVWNVIGYAGSLVPDDRPPMALESAARPFAALSDDALADALDAKAQGMEGLCVASAKGDWLKLLLEAATRLLPLILTLLG